MLDTTAPPFDPMDLEPTLRPFGQSRMLPRDAYVSPRVFAFEQEWFFAGSWTCVGREGDLEGTGAQRAVRVGGAGALLVRGTDRRVRAFANTCRHRGHELLGVGEQTTRRTILCPYHAWTYDLDGAVRAAPGFRDHADFRPEEHGLVELPLESWHGFLFVNGSGDAPPFAEHVGALDDLVAPYRPERLLPLVSHSYDLACNWKVVLENYHECYHCPLIHPELCQVSPPASGDNFELDGAWVGGTMDLKDHAVTMSLDGHSDGVPIPGLDGERLRTVAYLGLFPNLLLSLHPDYVMTHVVEPLGPALSHVVCTWYFPPEATGRPGFDPSYAVDFWDRTNRQDWAACESVQRGMASPHFQPGPLAPAEDAVYHVVTMIARAYLGERPSASPRDGTALTQEPSPVR
ncbi:MAG TPA: aromatic ring-hydroxylating dioxygenase subunit alpha [Actinomycetota bacterium]|jgi:Rieske 2Fe-2S family protein|nr:aromatic ring-hydroxylating dioxygenase subunit alpha [Actinomycetota bacterium]